MIHYIKRKDLDVVKYDACIENSLQSRVYAFSWYLDIVADNWDVLVSGDYEAVMPIPWRNKYGIKYVYPPFWLLEFGIFSSDKKTNLEPFIKLLFEKFRFVESRLNTDNELLSNKGYLVRKQCQLLYLDNDYDFISNQYRKDRKKDIRKAKNLDLIEKWNDNPVNLISLFKNNVGVRTSSILEKDYENLESVMKVCIQKKVGQILSIYNVENKLLASGFFLKHKNTITILVSSTDFKNRNNGSNTFLIDRAIFKYEKNYNTFNFGGSSMKSIANYFLSFGAKTKEYQQIKYNNLPFLLRLFKK